MELNQYQVLAARTMNKDLEDSATKLHAIFGLASEVGEIHGLYQKSYQGHELYEFHLQKQLGDLLWFVAEYATAYGWSLQDIARMNIEKLMARYPQGFEAEKSLNRKEGDI